MKVRLALPKMGAVASCVAVLLALIAALVGPSTNAEAQSSSVRPPANAVVQDRPGAQSNPGLSREPYDPTSSMGAIYDSEMWKKVRKGISGNVSIPDKSAGQLVQSGGWEWMKTRNQQLTRYGVFAMGGMLALLALFFLVRGRIRIEHGWSGRTITRFTEFERIGHWLLAVSFIILGLTGLNVLYGRSVLMPLIGKEAFAAMTIYGKLLHNYVAFAFMIGLAMTFVIWIRHNFPNRDDAVWLLRGGGMFTKGSHPPARKFNAGQKILFWLIMLGGVSISLSGLALLFPFTFPMFAKTFALLNIFGLGLPTAMTPVEEMQYAALWHSIMGLFLVCVIFAHIYIGTLGMEGAFSAMGTGEVDVNWAKEHHSLWAEEVLEGRREEGASSPPAKPVPAE